MTHNLGSEMVNFLDSEGLVSTDDELLVKRLEEVGFTFVDPSERDKYVPSDDETENDSE